MITDVKPQFRMYMDAKVRLSGALSQLNCSILMIFVKEIIEDPTQTFATFLFQIQYAIAETFF